MKDSPIVQNTAVVKLLEQSTNRVIWIPYDEMEAYFVRYSEMRQQLDFLKSELDDNNVHLHDFGTRLLIRYRVYDNIHRTFRHGIHADVALVEAMHLDRRPDVRNSYQPFYGNKFINLDPHCEITHFAFILVA